MASRGGRAVAAKGNGHKWTKQTAASAGRKGGVASRGGRGKVVSAELATEETKADE